MINQQDTTTNQVHQLPDLYLKEECYNLIGAAFETHKILGSGFLESVYQEAFEIELNSRNIPFISQPQLELTYKDHKLAKKFKPDLLVYGEIIVEIKAINSLSEIEEAQLINYLKATNFHLGLLINFGSRKMEWKRRILFNNH
jgi:GxxExxY protein